MQTTLLSAVLLAALATALRREPGPPGRISHSENDEVARDGAFKCPDAKYDLYEDPVQCDKYVECFEGKAVEKLCPDGLVFDPTNRKIINRCDQPFNVDCGERLELQPAKPSQNCPRQNGFFAHPNPAVCDVFYNCIDGEATESRCPPGLHFDEFQGVCVWPDSAKREGCQDASSMKLKDGFQCPSEAKVDGNGQALAHPQYAHPTDCQKFYVCLNNVQPREQGCSLGEVYNDEIGKCDDPDNVPECADWYKDDPEVAQLKAKAAEKAAKKNKNNRE